MTEEGWFEERWAFGMRHANGGNMNRATEPSGIAPEQRHVKSERLFFFHILGPMLPFHSLPRGKISAH
jgi:hypothetical protein